MDSYNTPVSLVFVDRMIAECRTLQGELAACGDVRRFTGTGLAHSVEALVQSAAHLILSQELAVCLGWGLWRRAVIADGAAEGLGAPLVPLLGRAMAEFSRLERVSPAMTELGSRIGRLSRRVCAMANGTC